VVAAGAARVKVVGFEHRTHPAGWVVQLAVGAAEDVGDPGGGLGQSEQDAQRGGP
jgi:hypothetical protein